jgi:hypothetical protein
MDFTGSRLVIQLATYYSPTPTFASMNARWAMGRELALKALRGVCSSVW